MSLHHILCIGKIITRIEHCNSTNEYAKKLLSKNAPIEGTTIITDNQTAGKGQYGNTWQSTAEKNLTLSIIIRPKMLLPNEQFYISIMTSLACVASLEKITNKIFQIKWPNDIYHNNSKIGGILIENQLQQNQISTSIIGIGLNINQNIFKNLPQATSLIEIERKSYDLDECLTILLEEMDKYYIQLRQGKQQQLLTQYYQKMMGYQNEVKFKKENGLSFKAIVNGISPIGELHLSIDGKSTYFGFKEIEWLF